MLKKERTPVRGGWRLGPWSGARAAPASMVIETAFTAGCESFIRQDFRFGDPEDFFHPPGHPHIYRPDYAGCTSCTPPVHGECLLLRCVDGEVTVTKGSEVTEPMLAALRGPSRMSRRLSRMSVRASRASRPSTRPVYKGEVGEDACHCAVCV